MKKAFIPGDLAVYGDDRAGCWFILKDLPWRPAGTLESGDVCLVINVQHNPNFESDIWYMILSARGFGYVSSKSDLDFVSRRAETP